MAAVISSDPPSALEAASTELSTTAHASPLESLRAELKAWEKSFASANEGRKPSRADIKAVPDMAQKYKTYNKLSGRAAPAPPPRPAEALATTTPTKPRSHKKRMLAECEGKENAIWHGPSPRKTPRKSPHHTSAPDSASPATPSALRAFVGPTPQRNGHVQGLFDLLSPASSARRAHPTPSHRAPDATPCSRKRAAALGLTPSKSRPASSPAASNRLRNAAAEPTDSAPADPGAAPPATPSASRTGPAASPASRETPAVLRRDAVSLFAGRCIGAADSASGSGEQDGDELSFSPVRMRRAPKLAPGRRPLSQLLRGLRQLEDEQLDDDLAALRDLEADEERGPPPIKNLASTARDMPATESTAHGLDAKDLNVTARAAKKPAAPKLAEAEWPLGPDGAAVDAEGGLSGAEDEAATAGRWRRKKAPKRTTRLVNIGVSTKRWEPEPEWRPGEAQDKKDTDPKGAAPRKKSATAHANFRALRIKNKNSKAKKGGRFGRR